MRKIGFVLALSALAAVGSAQEATVDATYEGRTIAEWRDDLTSKEVKTRQAAAYALWSLGPDAANAASELVAAISDVDPYVRTTSAKALDRLTDDAKRNTMDAVTALLSSDREEVRREAATYMWRIGPLAAEIVPALATALASDDADVRANVAGALGNAGDAAKTQFETLETMTVEDADSDARKWSGIALATIDGARALRSEHSAVRLAAAKYWSRPDRRGCQRADICAAVLERVDDSDEEVRFWMTYNLDSFAAFLGEERPTDWIPVFEHISRKGRVPEVRANGAYGLGRFVGHGERVVPTLIEIAANKEPAVQRAGILALGWLGKEAAAAGPVVIAAAESGDARTRGAVAVALGNLQVKSERVIATLITLANDDDRMTQRSGVRALGSIGAGSRMAADALVRILEDSGASRPQRGAAARALTAVEQPDIAIPALTRVFSASPDLHVSIAAGLVALDAPNANDALTHLIAGLGGDEPALTTVNALGGLGPKAARATSAVSALLTHTTDPTIPFAAADALRLFGPAAKAALPALQAIVNGTDKNLAAAATAAIDAISPSEQREPGK